MEAQAPETAQGLNELVDVLNLMGTAPPGVRPQVKPELIDVIKASPLQPVVKPLHRIYKKLFTAAEAEQAGSATPKAEPQLPQLGLNELVDLLNLLGTAPPGARPQLNLIDVLKASPLQPLPKPPQGIYKKFVAAAEAEQAGPEPQSPQPGLNELVDVLNLMGTAPLGARPKLNPDLINVIKASPLQPVLKPLQGIYKKFVAAAEAEQAGPATPKAEPATPKIKPQPPQPGLSELVDVLDLMGTAPPGVRPQVNPELIDVIKASPLQPVVKPLHRIYKKLFTAAEAEQAGPATSKAEPQPPQPGLNELVDLLNLMGTASSGAWPQLNPDLIDVIKASPLQPVLKPLQGIYKKLVAAAEAEQAGPATPKAKPQPPQPPQRGFNELVDVLNLMGTVPPGARPQLNPDLIDAIKASPLQPILKPLQGIYKKLVAAAEAEQAGLGLNELVDVLTLMGTAPPGVRPQVNPEHIQVIKGSPLQPVVKPLQGIYKKLVAAAEAEQAGPVTPKAEPQPPQPPTPPPPRRVRAPTPAPVESAPQQQQHAPVPMDAAELKDIEAGMKSLSSKLDPALHELSEGIKKLQAGLLDNAKADKTRLEAKVNELQHVIDATRTELLPLEVASKIALQGTFSEDAEKPSTRAGAANANVVQTAKRVRTNTLGLIAKCRALFTFINRDPAIVSAVPDLGTEGEWGRCAEHLRASNTRLRSAVEEREESARKLQFVGFVVDQIRKGRYTEREWKSDINGKSFFTLIEESPDGFAGIQLLAQDISRLTAAAMTAPVAPVVPVAPAYGIPPGNGTPPPSLATAMASQAFTTRIAYDPWDEAGISTAKPTTGGTRPRVRGNASTDQASAGTDSLARLLSP